MIKEEFLQDTTLVVDDCDKNHLYKNEGLIREDCSEMVLGNSHQSTIHLSPNNTEVSLPASKSLNLVSEERKNFELYSMTITVEKVIQTSPCTYKTSEDFKHSTIQSGEKPFKCISCPYQTLLKGNLQRHLRIHTGVKPFKCSSCSYLTNEKASLLKHSRIHTGEKPFNCSSCPYQAREKSHLQRHFRMHTKPFKCSSCPYQTKEKERLQKHLKIHSGEKPFKCCNCSYRAARKGDVNRHLRLH